MIEQTRKRVNREVASVVRSLDNGPISALPGRYCRVVKAFAGRDGKRIRPVLFVLAYRGYSGPPLRDLYRAAAALELFHAFSLIHDDIVDRSATRNGRPSLHAAFGRVLPPGACGRVRGEDLAMIAGDVLFAKAVALFNSARARPARKCAALARLMDAALYTGCGEMEEMLLCCRPLAGVSLEEIYRVYDRKTAQYTFVSPLLAGAVLAGAPPRDLRALTQAGTLMGRAFQLRDDIGDLGMGLRGRGACLQDIADGRRTALLWFAYRNGGCRDRRILDSVAEKKNASVSELKRAGRIIVASGAPDFAEREIVKLLARVRRLTAGLSMRPRDRTALDRYCAALLGRPPRPPRARRP